ncbi:MAG: hypothetical protein R3C32_08590 [Chloroflexota bacterium]
MPALAPRAAHQVTAEPPDPETVRLCVRAGVGRDGQRMGVQPSVAMVHGYLLAHGGVLTEREVREALDLSHRATSLALGRRGGASWCGRRAAAQRPARTIGTAVAVGDQWLWLQRIARQRAAREADPLVPRVETCLSLADEALRATPGDPEAARLRAWLLELLGFLRLFERVVGLLARAESAEIARGFAVLARIPDASLDRLLRLFASLPEEELAGTIEAISRVSPRVARRVLAAADTVARLTR